MPKSKTYNKYDIYIIVIIAIQFFGIYGGALQPVRVFSIISFPFLLASDMKSSHLREYRYEFLFFLLFIIWGLFLTVFAIYIEEALKEIIYLVVSFNMIFNVIIASGKAKNPKLSIIKGWGVLLLLALPIGLYEIYFDWHFSNSKTGSGTLVGGYNQVVKNFAALTFGNYNLFNVVIVYAIPFLISCFFIKGLKKKIKVIIWGLILMGSFIVLVNGSRGSFLAIILCFLLFFRKSFFKNKKNIFILVILISGSVYYLMSKGGNLLLTFTDKKDRLFSDNTRSTLIEFSLKELINSNFLGVGPANIEQIIINQYQYKLGATHNLFIEILVQYGIIIFIGFLYFLFRIYKRSFKVDKISKYIVITSLVLIPLSSVVNSKYLAGVNIWLLLGSLLIISNDKLKKIV